MDNILVILVVALIVGLAVLYIHKQKNTESSASAALTAALAKKTAETLNRMHQAPDH